MPFGTFLRCRTVALFCQPVFYALPIRSLLDPDPKSCSIQKQNSGMIKTPLNGGGADEKVTIH
ncbi:hypothetical protein EC392_14670 [Lonsdalea populi]|uniref:Uncharacterized protein n=1 Tax=Lonsdalea populi TaxID=1172565 RepID=A0A3N0UA62_9GAMM|nr:hypothetical protein EC393_14665 [Lonsdalea populi]ROH77188.1 hypothetical protein EC392_14670 [Lonsdalea populi]ROH77534.1 hypothetical protein EC394_14840 [Lonsdalea populi]